MFYGTLILAKKGPLAKVWLAAHWDKKLTKAHVFETDVESTVDNIISPSVKLALRTSGHLLLGVVRIYSRKQKYLIQDLGEACAKIKMAFRPGIIDLPSTARGDNPDALVLPEVFHDFDDATVDMGILEAQFTVNSSRMSEINIPDDTTTSYGGLFAVGEGAFMGGEFEAFDVRDGDFGGGMQDIEFERLATSTESNVEGSLNKGKDYKDVTSTTIEEDDRPKTLTTIPEAEDICPDARNDFGEGADGFGMTGDDDGFGEFVDMPSIADVTPEGGESKNEMEVTKVVENKVEPMEVDEPQKNNTEFSLQPLETSQPVADIRARRKRRVVVDNDKEFSGQQIKSQFEDFKDLLQPKCFPPPTKKAMMWREMAGCEQLYSHSTSRGMAIHLASMIKANYTTGDVFRANDTIGEMVVVGEIGGEEVGVRGEEVGVGVGEVLAGEGEVVVGEQEMNGGAGEMANGVGEMGGGAGEVVAAGVGEMGDGVGEVSAGVVEVLVGEGEVVGAEGEVVGGEVVGAEGEVVGAEGEVRVEAEELGQFDSADSALGQSVSCMVDIFGLHRLDSVKFSSVTTKCDRKQVASRFYTCLLLAKEGVIVVEQSEPYAEIHIRKGPKFT